MNRRVLKALKLLASASNRIPGAGFISNSLHAYRQGIILKYIKNNYCDLLDELNASSPFELESVDFSDTCPIWVMWWQGVEGMPPIVRACYNNLLEHAGAHPVHVITRDNYLDFLSKSPLWSEKVLVYVNNGLVSLTLLSDLIRTSLLYHFGGVWVDSTVFVCENLDSFLRPGENSFFTGKRIDVPARRSVPRGLWTSYFVGGGIRLLYKYIFSLIVKSLEREGSLLDYFMVDYSFVTAYRENRDVRNMVNDAPVIKDNIMGMMSVINKRYDSIQFNKMLKEMPFYKLTYKHDFKMEDKQGNITLYGYLINTYAGNSTGVS